MYNGDYLEKILGEKYNIKNFYENSNDVISYTDDRDIFSKNQETDKIEKIKDEDNKEFENVENKNENKSEDKNEIKKENKQQNPIEFFEYQYKPETLSYENIEKQEDSQFDDFYPDIYRILIPMIDVVLDKNKNEVLDINLIEKMAREIYNALVIDVSLDDKNYNSENNNNNNNSNNKENNENNKNNKDDYNIIEMKPKNTILLDLIKILILYKIKK